MLLFSGLFFLILALVGAGLLVWVRKRQNKKRTWSWGLGVVLFSCVLIHCFVIFDIRYDLRMYSAVRQFEAMPLPPKTISSETHSLFGLIFGNSNHCDYFVGNLLRSELSLEQLQKHYSAYSIISPLQSEKPDKPAIEAWRENSWLVPVPDYLSRAVNWKLPALGASKGQLYLLSVSDGGYPPDDLRCH